MKYSVRNLDWSQRHHIQIYLYRLTYQGFRTRRTCPDHHHTNLFRSYIIVNQYKEKIRKYNVRKLKIEVKGMTFKSTFTGLRTKVLGPSIHVDTITTLICFTRILSKPIQTKKKEILRASGSDLSERYNIQIYLCRLTHQGFRTRRTCRHHYHTNLFRSHTIVDLYIEKRRKYYVRKLQIEVKGITLKSTLIGLRTKVLGPREYVSTITKLVCFDLILS